VVIIIIGNIFEFKMKKFIILRRNNIDVLRYMQKMCTNIC